MAVKAPGALPQPLSGKDYAVIAIAMVVVGVVLLVLFIVFAPRLVPADILNQFFYIVLIVWGVVSALLLFGVMRSYARVSYKTVGGAVELGGPAAFAALVVVGGFWLVPRSDTFTLTIRPHGPGAPMITSGQIRVEFGNVAQTQEINAIGEADFKGVQHKYRGATVQVLPLVDGYKQEYQSVLLNRDFIDLNLVKPETVLKGRIVPAPREGQQLSVLIQGEDGEQVPHSDGRFQFIVHKNVGARVRVTVCSNGRSIFDDYKLLAPDEVAISTHKPAGSCR
jgi:hypothetical protein